MQNFAAKISKDLDEYKKKERIMMDKSSVI